MSKKIKNQRRKLFSPIRFIPFGLDMDSGHWVSGGSSDAGLERSSEIYDGSSFSDSVDLVLSTRDHCAVRIGKNEALVMGGE